MALALFAAVLAVAASVVRPRWSGPLIDRPVEGELVANAVSVLWIGLAVGATAVVARAHRRVVAALAIGFLSLPAIVIAVFEPAVAQVLVNLLG